MNDETNSLLSVLSKLSGIFKANADEKAKTEPQNKSAAPQSQPYTQPQNNSAALTQGTAARDATNEFIKTHTTLAQKIRSNASAKDFAPLTVNTPKVTHGVNTSLTSKKHVEKPLKRLTELSR